MREVGFLEEKFAILGGNDCFLKQEKSARNGESRTWTWLPVGDGGGETFFEEKAEEEEGKTFLSATTGAVLKGRRESFAWRVFGGKNIYTPKASVYFSHTKNKGDGGRGVWEKQVQEKKRQARKQTPPSPPPSPSPLPKHIEIERRTLPCMQAKIYPAGSGCGIRQNLKKREKVLEKQA